MKNRVYITSTLIVFCIFALGVLSGIKYEEKQFDLNIKRHTKIVVNTTLRLKSEYTDELKLCEVGEASKKVDSIIKGQIQEVIDLKLK